MTMIEETVDSQEAHDPTLYVADTEYRGLSVTKYGFACRKLVERYSFRMRQHFHRKVQRQIVMFLSLTPLLSVAQTILRI